jgi:hypothetical protein
LTFDRSTVQQEEEKMSGPAKTIFYFGVYLVVVGLALYYTRDREKKAAQPA